MTTQPAVSAAVSANVAQDGEVPALRSATSNTYADGGLLHTSFSTTPVNFLDESGAWEPIDNTLVAVAAGRGVTPSLTNESDEHQVLLPPASGAPVTMTKDALTFTSTLIGGAAVPIAAEGDTATYRNVFPGVDELFTSRAGALEQFFRLASADVRTSFVQNVTLSAGFTLGQPNAQGSIEIRNAAGELAGLLPAPVISDASDNPDTGISTTAAHFTVTGSAPAWSVTTVIDPQWLKAPGRQFPVLLDPTITVGDAGALACAVAMTGTPAKLCSSSTGTDNPLSYGYTGALRRIFIRFPELTQNTSPIPLDAQLSDAELVMTQKSTVTAGRNIDSAIHRVTANWTEAGIAWGSQPAFTTAANQKMTVAPPGDDQIYRFSIAGLAEAWIKTTVPNYGLVLKAADETPYNTITWHGLANAAHHPELVVTWTPRVGQEKAVGTYDRRLNDRMDMHVSYGSRNLVINGLDTQIASFGMPLTVRRTYNSLLAKSGIGGAYGLGWSMSGGVDTGLSIAPSGITFVQPGGARAFFERNPAIPSEYDADSYRAERNGLDADLVRTDATHYTMTFRKTRVKHTFTLPAGVITKAYLSKTQDGDGNAVTYTASGSPLVTTTLKDTTGTRAVTFNYTSGRVSTMTESLGAGVTGARTFTYGYDGSGHLTTFTDPDLKITRFCYTGDLITRIITPRGSAAGVGCTTTNPANTTDVAYDAAGKVLTVTYRNGASPAITLGFDTTVAQSYPSTLTGRTTFTDAYGKTSNYFYDTNDRVTKVLNPFGDERAATYNTNGDVTASISANNATGGGGDGTASTSSYDASNNRSSTTIPTGSTVSMEYTSGTHLYQPSKVSDDRDTSTTGPAATTLAYGSNGQVTSSTKGTNTTKNRRQGDSGVTNCGPAGAAAYPGALCETREDATTGAAHRTLMKYNSLGQLTSMTPAAPGSGRTTPAAKTYDYDGFSRVTSITNSRGQATTNTYDKLDRLTKSTYDDGSSTTLVYDVDGNLQTRTDKDTGGYTTFTVTYLYDGLNRLISEQPTGQTANTTTWDANSRMLTFTDTSGTITYGYDDAGSLTSLAQPGGSCTGFSPTAPPTSASLCTIYPVDKDGDRMAIIYPGNLARQEYTYDKSNRVIRILARSAVGGTTTNELEQNYKFAIGTQDTGHLITRENAINSRSTSYTYTNEGWLQTATNKVLGGSTTTSKNTYCYDQYGNRSYTSGSTSFSSTACAANTNSTWDGANGQLTGPSGTAADFIFDVDGNETSTGTSLAGAGTRASTWGVREQNTAATPAGDPTLGNTNFGAGNTYRRLTKINSTDSHTFRNSMTGITEVAASNGSSTTAKTYIQREPSGQIAGFLTSTGQHYYPFTDRLGSIWVVVDSTSSVVAEVSNYDPYGTPSTTTTAPFLQPFGYTGAYTHPTSGLIHLSARFYDPALGRFTQKDPSGQDPYDYSYAGNDPVNSVDPSGLWSFELSGEVCLWGGCISGSIGVDDDWDVSAGVGGGLGTPGAGGGLNVDPNGDYTPGEYDVDAGASCSYGYGSASVDFVDDGFEPTYYAGTPGCSVGASGSYTFG